MRRILFCTLLSAMLLAGCTTVPQGSDAELCKQANGSKQLQAELLFGRDIHEREPVTDAERAKFMADVVTPLFPDGLTTWDTRGQWRDAASGKTIQENSFVIRIVAAESAETMTRLSSIRSAYVAQFRQDAVGLLFSRVCASF